MITFVKATLSDGKEVTAKGVELSSLTPCDTALISLQTSLPNGFIMVLSDHIARE